MPDQNAACGWKVANLNQNLTKILQNSLKTLNDSIMNVKLTDLDIRFDQVRREN